ncbi:MAG: hypothetical protein DRJ10_03060 [Bacteroidetes bacterium]|nr:MAG: hypothetical protein DRJ10_03060 [Bacteroidota bacterium]
MNKFICILFFLISLSFQSYGQDSIQGIQDTLKFKGQLSTWAHFNPDNPYPLYLGGRYIPQLNYEIQLSKNKLIDFELSANLYGDAGIHFFDSAYIDGNINPYRLWGRYSTEQLEVRIGLQKIDFGTATMLRSLRWFDQVDPRDPLRLTEGVWAALGRYYFLNNMNIWLWGLYGNKNLKGLEVLKTNADYPEFGGRFQSPVPMGEAAISYHHRIADSRDLNVMIPGFSEIQENRIGLDTKWDLIVGLWLEAAWVNKKEEIGILKNQEALTLGTDYTFNIGSGLYVTLEHMLIAFDEKAFEFSNTTNFTGLSINYPIGMFDNISAIFYYDWTNNAVYNFVNWFRQFDRTTFYVMAYWNPENNQMPTMGIAENLYGGIGVQLMFVFNH